jgi:hypothetical protein
LQTMSILYFVFFFFLAVMGVSPALSWGKKSIEKTTSVSDIPKTISFPKGIVDQDKKLSKEDAASIAATILQQYAATNLNIGVVLVQKMNQTGLTSCKDCAPVFANKLYSSFALGHLGVLIFVSEADQQIVVDTGSSLKDLLPAAAIAELLTKAGVFTALKSKKVGSAVTKTIKVITDMLDAPSTSVKLKARKWGYTTWAVGLSSAVITMSMAAIGFGTLIGLF